MLSYPRRRQCRRRQGGFAVIASIIFLVVLLLIGSIMVEQAVMELDSAGKARKDTQAFNVAEAGIDYAAWQAYNIGQSNLTLPTTWTRADLEGGTFSVTASQYQGTNATIILVSTGTSQGHQAVVKVIGAFLPTTLIDQNAVFGYALFSNSDLTLGGTASIDGQVHANGKITVNGSPTVTGDVSAVGTISRTSPNFQGDVTPHSPRTTMPAIDMQYYINHATTIYSSSHNFTGSSTLDGITFVNGDVTINSTFSGKGIIVATGTVTINGNATLENPATDEFAVMSARGVRINGTCTIQGWIYAHNVTVTADFTGNGNATIVGGIAADIVSKSNGTLNITYKEPTVDLPGGQYSPSQLDAVSWRRVR